MPSYSLVGLLPHGDAGLETEHRPVPNGAARQHTAASLASLSGDPDDELPPVMQLTELVPLPPLPPVAQLPGLLSEATADEARSCAERVRRLRPAISAEHGLAGEGLLDMLIDELQPGSAGEPDDAATAKPGKARAAGRGARGGEEEEEGAPAAGRMYELLLCALLGVSTRLSVRRGKAPLLFPIDEGGAPQLDGTEGRAARWLLPAFARENRVGRAECAVALVRAGLDKCREVTRDDLSLTPALLARHATRTVPTCRVDASFHVTGLSAAGRAAQLPRCGAGGRAAHGGARRREWQARQRQAGLEAGGRGAGSSARGGGGSGQRTAGERGGGRRSADRWQRADRPER